MAVDNWNFAACRHGVYHIDNPCPRCGRLDDSALRGVTGLMRGEAKSDADIPKPSNANAVQHGGSHYKDCPIQPWDYIVQNGLGYLEGNVVKYVSRWRVKGGVEDLRKARHYLDKLIELETAHPNNNED